MTSCLDLFAIGRPYHRLNVPPLSASSIPQFSASTPQPQRPSGFVAATRSSARIDPRTPILSTGVGRALALTVLLLNQLVLARLLGKEEFGRYGLATVMTTLISLFATGGFSVAAVVVIAGLRARGDERQLAHFTRFARRTAGRRALGLLMISGSVTAIVWLIDDNFRSLHTVVAGIALMPCLAVLQVLTGELQGWGQVGVGVFLQEGIRHATQLLCVAALAFSGHHSLNAGQVLWLQVLGSLLGSGIALRLLVVTARRTGAPDPVSRRYQPGQHQRDFDHGMSGAAPDQNSSLPCVTPAAGRAATNNVAALYPSAVAREQELNWRKTATALGVATFLQNSLAQIDVLLVGLLTSFAVTGSYVLATRFAALSAFGLSTLNSAASPSLGAAWAKQDLRKAQQIVDDTARWGWYSAVLISLTIAVTASWLLPLFGTGYSQSLGPLWILLIAQLINAALGPGLFILNGTGQGMATMRLLGWSSALQAMLVSAFAPWAMAEGAAVAVLIVTLFWNIWAARETLARSGLRAAPWLPGRNWRGWQVDKLKFNSCKPEK